VLVDYPRIPFNLCKNSHLNVLLIDNYDSFTFNIVELLRQLDVDTFSIYKNDAITIDQARDFDKIIISPGPAIPSESGIILELIKALSSTHSILGICLGHQAIAEAFGAKLTNEKIPYHGFQTSLQLVKEHTLFRNLASLKVSSELRVGLYHSWSVDVENFPVCLEITSFSNEGKIMSLRHTKFDIHGVQFHPESYMTSFGKEMLSNFLFDN